MAIVILVSLLCKKTELVKVYYRASLRRLGPKDSLNSMMKNATSAMYVLGNETHVTTCIVISFYSKVYSFFSSDTQVIATLAL